MLAAFFSQGFFKGLFGTDRVGRVAVAVCRQEGRCGRVVQGRVQAGTCCSPEQTPSRIERDDVDGWGWLGMTDGMELKHTSSIQGKRRDGHKYIH